MNSVIIPPSKSITQRAIVCASLAKGTSIIKNPLFSEDVNYLINAFKKLGLSIRKKDNNLEIKGNSGEFTPNGNKKIFMGNNGTGFRFLIPICCIYPDLVELTGNERMKNRPIAELVDVLNDNGFEIRYLEKNGFPPILCKKSNLKLKRIKISSKNSSQFVSSLLLSSPLFLDDFEIEIAGEIPSMPYIDLTLMVMRFFGVSVKRKDNSFFISKNSKYIACEFEVEGDFSSASYFLSFPFFSGKEIIVENLNYYNSIQPDKIFVDILKRMGGKFNISDKNIKVFPGKLNGITINMKNSPDIVPTLSVLSSISKGETIITGISHLKIKESDRIYAIYKNLKKFGIDVICGDDFIKIKGNEKKIKETKEVSVETFNDHRIAMSFSLFKLLGINVNFDNPECVKKSFPNYWEIFNTIKL